MANPSPFDFVKAINYSKENLFTEKGYKDSDYLKFLVNRNFSYFPDTIMVANCANQYLDAVPAIAHFNFYRFLVEPKKRFSGKWAKSETTEDVELISKLYQISLTKAEEYAKILTKEQLKKLHNFYNLGGKQND